MGGNSANGFENTRRPKSRALLGLATVVGIVAIGAGGYVIAPSVTPVSSTPSETAMRLAAERGIDLTRRTPGETAARLLKRVDNGDAIEATELSSTGGIITTESNGIFTGYAVDRHPDGSVRTVYGVLEGRAAGPAVQLHPNGMIHRAWGYLDGKMCGQILEKTAEDTLVFRALAGPASQNGGTMVGEITLDSGRGWERYRAGRFQWSTVGGSTVGVSESLRPDEIGSFMLYERGLFGHETLLVADGRVLSGG
ncbi:MAG: hypothetical protein AAF297_10245 [Planctomycetota bacterium]